MCLCVCVLFLTVPVALRYGCAVLESMRYKHQREAAYTYRPCGCNSDLGCLLPEFPTRTSQHYHVCVLFSLPDDCFLNGFAAQFYRGFFSFSLSPLLLMSSWCKHSMHGKEAGNGSLRLLFKTLNPSAHGWDTFRWVISVGANNVVECCVFFSSFTLARSAG